MKQKQKNKKEKRWYEDEDDEGEEEYEEKSVGLIVERTFRDSSQPLALPKILPFHDVPSIQIPKADQIFRRPVHLSESLTKLMDRPYRSMGLSFDETRRDEDETLTVKHVGENHVCRFVENNFLGAWKTRIPKRK